MNVSAIIKTDGACDFYRAVQPLEMLARNNETKIAFIRRGADPVETEEALKADVILIPRVADFKMVDVIKDLQANGKKVVIDYDDDLYNVSPLSEHYKEHGTEEFTAAMPDGSSKKVWTDGVDFDIKKNKESLMALNEAVSLADLITVPTDIIAETYRRRGGNVVVLPNCVDFNIWKPLDFKETEEIRLFWAGGSSHYEDWMLLSDVMPNIFKKYKNVKLVLMGMKWDATLKGIPEDRIEYHPWVPTPAYPYKVASLNPTIGVIPLVDNKFNRSKSAIKWIELAALGVPCVSSYVSPYKEIATEGNGMFIKNNSRNAWIQGLSALIDNSILRAKVGGEAMRYAKSHFDASRKSTMWKCAYSALFQRKKEAI